MPIVLAKDLAALRAAATARIDAQAETARQAWITLGSGQAMVYQAKGDEAARFLAAYPDATAAAGATASAWPLLNAEVGITGPDLYSVASTVSGMASAWTSAAAEIEAKRLAAKAAVKTANSEAAIDTAATVDWPKPA